MHDTDIICSIKYNEAYILCLLETSNYFSIQSCFRAGKNNDLFYKTSKQKCDILDEFLMRYYDTCFPDTAFFCLERKYDSCIRYKCIKDDLSINEYKDNFNVTKDDSFIDYKKYDKYCKYIDTCKYYCDYCSNIVQF
jgi:hypothetical protein